MAEKPYPKIEYVAKRESAVLQCSRVRDKVIEVPRELPGNIILVHGVNDVGMGYSAAEEGLCCGLQDRLFRYFKPAEYRLPTKTEKEKLEQDPDDVFFKRKPTPDTDSPVIPFYWGYRELRLETRTVHGQKTDRYDTRLDKDLSKGGGPFGNATATLPDMWNRGVYAAGDPVGDALRPIRTGPGRMYMVLAAMRLAALISMIRKFEPKDTVSIVAHSQGCLLSLLAQALLMERGERTADTLILTHPPYSLEEEMSLMMKGLTFFRGGKDAAMTEADYELLDGRQSMHARLQTLVNIVAGVAKSKAGAPAFSKINESDNGGMVASCWQPEGDRDNRGKVYLSFCPEDMTVPLDNMRGIGWQGVPDYLHTVSLRPLVQSGYAVSKAGYQPRHTIVTRKPMDELGTGFFQRVFTAKHRLDPRTGKTVPVLIGQPPHDFALCIKDEDGHAHVAASARSLREKLPVATWPINQTDKPEAQRWGIRRINGEPLHPPYKADLRGNQIAPDMIPASSRLAQAPLNKRGPSEEVDPMTAAIAVTATGGMDTKLEELSPAVAAACVDTKPGRLSKLECQRMQAVYNEAKHPNDVSPDNSYTILSASRRTDGTVVAYVMESPNAARKRWQHELGEKSFHSAIYDSPANHRNVTAYDVAIGSGKASIHPKFHAYLCAVADWRLKKPAPWGLFRKGILMWPKFLELFSDYFECEPDWRRQIIEGNVDYYSDGTLPKCLPVLTGRLWEIVVSETTTGKRVSQATPPKEKS